MLLGIGIGFVAGVIFMIISARNDHKIIEKILLCLIMIIAFVPVIIYGMLRWSIKGITAEQFEKVKNNSIKKIGCFHLCRDKQAFKFWNKIFLVRVKKRA
jgi:ABC-type dipeptide/oligopeptide/nickel transport system permease component